MQPGILDGVKVLDFSVGVAGPLCSRIMADMGAEVIKVERPTGDPERFAPDAIRKGGVEVLFLHCNGGKKSVCIDLKQPRGPELFRSLASQVDVVVENYTPQVLAGYGLDYQSLRQVNPGVVMLSTTGYGQQGLDGNPRLPCTDPVAQAMGRAQQHHRGAGWRAVHYRRRHR